MSKRFWNADMTHDLVKEKFGDDLKVIDNLTHNWLDEAMLDRTIHRLQYRFYPRGWYMNENRIWRAWLCSN